VIDQFTKERLDQVGVNALGFCPLAAGREHGALAFASVHLLFVALKTGCGVYILLPLTDYGDERFVQSVNFRPNLAERLAVPGIWHWETCCSVRGDSLIS